MKLSFAALISTVAAAAASSSSSLDSDDVCLDPSQPGTYGVGFSQTGLVAAYDRANDVPGGILPYNLYLPTDPDFSGDGPAVFTISPDFFRFSIGGAVAVDDPTVADLPIANDSDGCFPLAVYSHGAGSVSNDSNDLLVHLASHGYVVAAPLHVGGSLPDVVADFGLLGNPDALREALEASGYDRPRDISAVVDAVLAGPLGSAICEDEIVAVGWSQGAFSALAAGNGVYSLSSCV